MLKKYRQNYQIAIFLGSIFFLNSGSYAADSATKPTPDTQLPNIDDSISIQTDNTRALDLSPHIWDRYVRGFRRDHNLSVESGYASTFWIVDKFGDLKSEQYRSRQIGLVAHYTFHIMIAGKTGYFLGSSAGYTLADEKKLDDQFQPSPSWLLPGVQTGLVYNYDPSGRIFLGVGAQLERFNELRTKRSSGEWQRASMTGESYQIFLGADVFILLDTAIHFAWSDSTTFFKRPTGAEDKLVDVKMKRRSQGACLGLLYHFL